MRYQVPSSSQTAEDQPPQRGSIEAIDPVSTPVPGQSLTMRPGSQKFERPWRFTDPDDCVMFMIDKMEENRELKEQQLSQIAAGVPIEYIVNTIAFVGFSEGLWSPDVAELIKPPLAMYFILTATAENIPMVVFNPEKNDQAKLSNEEIITNMASLNPEAFEIIGEAVIGEQQKEEDRGGFLKLEDDIKEMPEEEEIQEDIQEGGMI